MLIDFHCHFADMSGSGSRPWTDGIPLFYNAIGAGSKERKLIFGENARRLLRLA
jgi:hypothetical protein